MNLAPKIVSLVPSATEILYFLGLEDYVVGVTEHCNYPEDTKLKCKVGTFAHPQLVQILSLQPDFVLADEALHRKLFDDLRLKQINVLSATPNTVDDIFMLMKRLAIITDKEISIQPLISSLKDRVDRLIQKSFVRKPRVFRLMSTDPLITPGPGSFQYEALRLAGAQMMDFQSQDPYVCLSWNQIREFDPEVILFCGVEKEQQKPIKCKGCIAESPICHRTADDIFNKEWEHITAIQENQIHPVSCDTLCRPGPRLIDGIEKLHKLFANW